LTPSLLRALARHLLRHPWLTLLSVLGIALGVAAVVAVDLANASATRALALTLETIAGRTTHAIRGGPAGVPESFYVDLRVAAGYRQSAPVIEEQVQLRGETFRLLGIDPLAERGFRDRADDLRDADVRRLMTEPGTVFLSVAAARRFGLALNDDFEVEAAGLRRNLRLIGVQNDLVDGLLIADIATAQDLLQRGGRLDRIDLILDAATVDGLAAALPTGLRLIETRAEAAAQERLTLAFRTNLTAMSLLALLVGGFLIYNAMTFSVLSRRRLLGALRVLGVTREGVLAWMLVEVSLLAVVGSLIGLLAGILIGQGLLQLVARSINDLYFVLSVTELHLATTSLSKGLLLGVGVSLLAALPPLVEALRVPPRAAMREAARGGALRRPWQLPAIGTLLMTLGGSLLLLGNGLVSGFVALFLLLTGFSLWVPLSLTGLARLLAEPLGRVFGAEGRLAARGLTASPLRTGVAAAALAIAVSATVGVGVMTASFRGTVDLWLTQLLQADFYIPAPGDAGHDPALPPRIASLPGVAELSTGRVVRIDSSAGPVELLALSPASRSRAGFRLKHGDIERIWPAFEAGEAVLVSEPFAFRHRLEVGDALTLHADLGDLPLTVAGIYYDYSSDQGMLVIHRDVYERGWLDRGIGNIGVFLAPDADAAAVASDIRRLLAAHDHSTDAVPELRSNREIRERSLAVFDRTFTITHVLRLLAVGVAFVGVLSALMLLQLERAREHAVLRATGMTPAGLWRMLTLQSGLLGLAAGLLALPLGLLMAEVLIEVIQRRSFGWSMLRVIPPGLLWQAVGLSVVAALLAAQWPAWRMARARPAVALREE
jgi:putative ABC transport system permease protein